MNRRQGQTLSAYLPASQVEIVRRTAETNNETVSAVLSEMVDGYLLARERLEKECRLAGEQAGLDGSVVSHQIDGRTYQELQALLDELRQIARSEP